MVSWDVQPLNDFTGVELGDNGLDWADKDMLSSYNGEMNSIISAFKEWQPNTNPDAYYLFVVPKFSEGGVEGFMPRNRRFGFVTLSQLDARLVAHEIGHGAFNLRHTFPEVAQGSTDNLMDYSEGNSLLKPQWDLIHNPETTTGLFDDMEDGAYYTTEKMVTLLNKIKSNNNRFINSQKVGTGGYLNIGKDGVVSEQDLEEEAFLKEYFKNPLSIKEDIFDVANNQDILNALKEFEQTPGPLTINRDVYDKAPPVLLAKEMLVKIDKNTSFIITMNGYSLSNEIITLYAYEEVINGNLKITFFNAKVADKSGAEKSVMYNRKAFDLLIHGGLEVGENFKKYLSLKEAIKLNETPAPFTIDPDELRIKIRRLSSNNYVTFGEIIVDNGVIKGATMELGKGTQEESKKECANELRTKCKCKRIPAVKNLPFKVNEKEGGKTQYHFKTLRLNDANGRGAILLHPGDGYEWSRGCILPMYTNELLRFKNNPSAIISKRMRVDEVDVENAGRVFVMTLVEYVERRKKENPNIQLLIDIIDDENETNLTISTEEFDRISRAGEIFYQFDILNRIDLTEIARKLVKNEILNIVNDITKLDEEVTKINNEIGGDKEKFDESTIRERLNKIFDENMIAVRTNINDKISKNPSIVNINKTKCEDEIEIIVNEVLNKNKDNKLFENYTVSDILKVIIDDKFGALRVNYSLPSDVTIKLKNGRVIIEELTKIKQNKIEDFIVKIKTKNKI